MFNERDVLAEEARYQMLLAEAEQQREGQERKPRRLFLLRLLPFFNRQRRPQRKEEKKAKLAFSD